MELIALIEPVVGIVKCCAPYIRQKLDFVFYKKNVQNVETQMDELAKKKAEIEKKLDLAETQNLHEPTPRVSDWLNKVRTLETETSSTDWEEGNQKCFMGLCVNWCYRYKLNKQVQQKASQVKNLIEEMQSFEGLETSTPPLPPAVVKMDISGYMETELSSILIKKITDLLESDSVKAIGVWGMGGIGKTTLVRKLNNHLESNSMFNKVITLKISQTPDWRQIHKQIAERIRHKLEDYESEDLRVNMLSVALKKEKSVLFIVDDVWANFQLYLLGIPNEASDAKYKVILTTRYQSVCAQMRIPEREQFELKPMSKGDSWKLFQTNYVGYDDVAIPTSLVPIAMELCDKCGGLPLAICTVSSSLRGDKSRANWNAALKQLTSSDQSQLDGILKPVFTIIEFSFNRLASEDVKLCFLYCCCYAKCAAPYIRQKLDFVFYKKNLRNVKTQMDKLAEKKAEIEARLDLAKRQDLHEPKPRVADWLEKVRTLETETSHIDWEEGNQKCFMGLCVNWRSRYKLNKQVQQKASEVKNLIEEMQIFEGLEISTPPLAPTVEKMNISGYMETELSSVLIQKITDLLESDNVKAIGVWGMGGIGKTMLVRKLNNHLESNSMFNKVITLKISQTPDWRQIHKQIAERIGLNLIDYESEDMRVNMLSMALKKEKSVLFIVDDVWAYFQLSLLGIPDEASDAKYKVILTTRSQSVCAQMRIGEREQFELKPMSRDDSWKLFQTIYVGYYDVAIPTTLVPIAIKLCDKCGGSPLAICILSSSLRGEKNRASWNDALKELTSSDQPQLDGILNPVFTSIEFSFNRLASEDVKLCFLYCCSYPGGCPVFIDDIRIYGISQRVIRERSLKEASEMVDAFVEVLRKSSLFINVADDEDKRLVAVHDIVRQVGIWIASKKYGFVVKSDQQSVELQLDENLLHSKFLSLSASKFKMLPNVLCCPNLLALDMSVMSCNQNVQIYEEFFAKTTKLTYLDISGIRIGMSNIPKSLYDLIHLRALDMRGIRNLFDISSIGKLKCLEILILDDTGIAELPTELGKLNNLRMLQLKNTHKLRRVAPNIFNQLLSLQELNMENSFNLWEPEGEYEVNGSLSEIFGLSELTTLHLDIIDPLCLQQDYMDCPSLSNLEKFRIVVATSGGFTDAERRFVKYLSLAEIPSHFGNWICKLFATCEHLELRESDVVETLPYRQVRVFNHLTELKISNLRFMKHIIDCHLIASRCENDVFPSLKQLEIEDMDNLEYLCNTTGSATRVVFSKLTHVKIHNCKNLRILFMGSMDQALQNVAEIHICHCDELEKLADVEGSIYFEKIKKIEVKDCGKLETLLAAEAEWEYLETICVSNCRSLQNIFHTSVFPQNLKHLTLENCKKLTTSVSVLIRRSFSRIETIQIVGCNPGNVKYLLSTNEIENPSNKNVFENLRVLEVRGFNGKGIFHGSISQSSLQNLAEVRIAFCNELTSIWGSSETFALIKPPKILVVQCCDKLN